MGMYTQLQLAIDLKFDTPKAVTDILQAMITMDLGWHKGWELPDHPFFNTDRWSWCLQSGGSYYFDGGTHREFRYDRIAECYKLTLLTNIKNYNSEWQHFLHWLQPYIDTEGFIGFLWYEEWERPKLIFNAEEGIKYD